MFLKMANVFPGHSVRFTHCVPGCCSCSLFFGGIGY